MSTISASELIQRLDQFKDTPRTDLPGTLAFKESKRALKAMAEKGEELSETERGSILNILQGKGFFRIRRAIVGPRFSLLIRSFGKFSIILSIS